MVSNFQRILDELRKESHLIARSYGLEPEALVTLIMEIVDLEDKNRVSAVARINQRIKGMIQSATQAAEPEEDS